MKFVGRLWRRLTALIHYLPLPVFVGVPLANFSGRVFQSTAGRRKLSQYCAGGNRNANFSDSFDADGVCFERVR
jgi:hypothetical protein